MNHFLMSSISKRVVMLNVKWRRGRGHTARTHRVLFVTLLISVKQLGKRRRIAEIDVVLYMKKPGDKWMNDPFSSLTSVSQSSLIVSLPPAQCGLISFSSPLIVHDDWKDNWEGDTCNQEWFQGQEMNLWQDLFLSSVFRITGEFRTFTSVQLLLGADIRLTANGKSFVLYYFQLRNTRTNLYQYERPKTDI